MRRVRARQEESKYLSLSEELVDVALTAHKRTLDVTVLVIDMR